MEANEELKAAVRDRNIPKVRRVLCACLMVDRAMTGIFRSSLMFVSASGIPESELFEEDDGQPIGGETTEDAFDEMVGCLSVNFSKKKLNELRRIRKALDAGKKKKTPADREVPPARGRFESPEDNIPGKNAATTPGCWITAAIAAVVVVVLLLKSCGR
jgi:hypothetical protein